MIRRERKRMAYPIFSRRWMTILGMATAMLVIKPASMALSLNMKTAPNTTKSGCPRQCGNLTVPYPFGVGLGSGCSFSPWHEIFCDTSYHPPRAFSPLITTEDGTMIQVLGISDTQVRIRNEVIASVCYNSTGHEISGFSSSYSQLTTKGAPYSLSPNNWLTIVGCDDQGFMDASGADDPHQNRASFGYCPTHCSRQDDVVEGECTGSNGCGQASIPKGVSTYSVGLVLFSEGNNHSSVASWNPCGYAFVAEEGSFSFRGAADLNDSTFVDRVRSNVTIVLDWFISNQTCSQARQDQTNFACAQLNTVCVEGDGGYRCNCSRGYEGNPYLDHGCIDIDECADKQRNSCSMTCTNIPGGYKCSCPHGYSGDGKKDGTGCYPIIPVVLGTILGFTILIVCLVWMSKKLREKMLRKKRERLFQRNGGNLLKQLLSSSNDEYAKIYTIEELAAATNNFAEDCIVGKGGYGTVYKGILPENQVVAIKKSKGVDESQIEQFINELVILSKVSHPNVVTLLGCCLEDEVPLLVYEFINNGTLYDHINAEGGSSWLSWSNCLRIAADAAKALAYLHSIPVIHRDVKSNNILLDDCNTVKISDFGISRLIPLGQTRLSTVVHGTLGYLDPEYFLSSQLTSKSDVYGFGVVLAELLTRESPILGEEEYTEEKNLSIYFLKSMETGCLNEIIHFEFVKEASQHQLLILGQLIEKCLSMEGKQRPTMTEVATVLEEVHTQASRIPQ